MKKINCSRIVILDSLPLLSANIEPNATCELKSFTLNPDGSINTSNTLIKINRKILESTSGRAKSPIQIAATIIHESIHAYLQIKRKDCSFGITLQELNNLEFQSLLEVYYNGNCANYQQQHGFMFDYLLPIMKDILSEIKNDMIPQDQQDSFTGNDYYIPNTPSCPLTESTPFNWNKFYESLSLTGLHNTEAYNQELDTIDKYLIQQYHLTATSLSKNCY